MNIWKKLQGWKQTIALMYWTIAVPLVPMWFPGDQMAQNISTTAGVILSAIGVSSALAKKYQSQLTNEVNNG